MAQSNILSYETANLLEAMLSHIYSLGRFGFAGMIETSKIRGEPLVAVYLIFAPAFYKGNGTEEISDFLRDCEELFKKGTLSHEEEETFYQKLHELKNKCYPY